MDSVCDVYAELDCLSVLLWLLEDAPASVHPPDDFVKLCKETLDQFQAILNLADLAATIGPSMFVESIQTCSDDTELKDCIANAKLCKTCISTARVSVLVKLLEKSLVQDLETLKKEAADFSSRDSGGMTIVIVGF